MSSINVCLRQVECLNQADIRPMRDRMLFTVALASGVLVDNNRAVKIETRYPLQKTGIKNGIRKGTTWDPSLVFTVDDIPAEHTVVTVSLRGWEIDSGKILEQIDADTKDHPERETVDWMLTADELAAVLGATVAAAAGGAALIALPVPILLFLGRRFFQDWQNDDAVGAWSGVVSLKSGAWLDGENDEIKVMLAGRGEIRKRAKYRATLKLVGNAVTPG